jgi:hypothetical protein
MLPEVKQKLMAIADDFREFLGIDVEVKDITVSGSNAAYTYTPHSDVDLHLVVDLPRADSDEVYRELFDAKKYQYNDQYNFKIGGADVELYVQNANDEHISQGIYSVQDNKWISVPKRRKPDVDDISVKSKYEDIGRRVDAAIESGNLEQMDAIAAKIREMRQAGLEKNGEFGPENLAFKVLRNNGTLDRLRTARLAAKDQALSITERKKKRAKKKTRYGHFGGVFFPGFHYYDQAGGDAGGDGGGGESVQENTDDLNTTIKKFAKYCRQELGIENMPRIRLKKDPEWSQRNATFGRYIPEENTLILSVADRHPMDIMRTLAHELIHRRQDEIEPMPDHAGETGSDWENEANAQAGVLMRGYGEQNPDTFDKQALAEASGYIPVTDAEARDPRYSMAVTVDVKPGEPKRQAAKLGWKTTAAGTPPTARTNGLIEELTRKLQMVKEGISFPLVSEEEELEEVAMSPNSLRAFANSPAAKGMQAGFEAELIFTGLGGAGESDPDWEADYGYDPRPDTIEEIIDFFQSGDFAGLSNSGAERLRNDMSEQYMEWLDEKMMEDWAVDQDGAIRDMIANEEPDLSDEELEDRVNTALSDQNGDYDSALDAYRDDWGGNYDEGDWLRDAGIRTMSDAENEYGLDWPNFVDNNEGDSGEGGFDEENAERLADDLAENLGVKTTVSGGYHSATRDATTWIFEPDSSLDPSDSEDMPVEIVSPPMPLTQALDVMPKFFAWAKENGAYANKTTGFHMSVSMPDHEGGALDYVKLALFLGDEYVLQQFGRSANTYAKSAISKIRDAAGKKLQEDDTKADAVLKNMRSSLNQFAARALAQPSGFGKYTSINPKGNYIEFRSAGGSDYFEDIEKIQNTLMRYAQATSLAMDPAAEKPEYAKKLYKLLTKTETEQVTDPRTGTKRTVAKPSADNDAISIFSRYVAGDLPKSELKGFLKKLQYGREVAKNPPTEKIQWQVTAGSQIVKVVATSEQAAKLEASREWNIDPNSERFSSFRAVPIGPAPTQTPATDQLNAPVPDDPRGNFVLRRREGNEGVGPVLYRFSAGTTGDAINAARRWTEARGIERRSVYLDSIESLSPEELRAAPEPAAQRPAGGQFTGQWAIRDGLGREVHRFVFRSTDQNTANSVAGNWARENNFDGRYTVTPVTTTTPPVETEPQNFPAARPPAGNDGHWEIRDSSTNQVLHTFSGIGTRWEDANQVAAQWLQQNGSGYSGTLLVHVTG